MKAKSIIVVASLITVLITVIWTLTVKKEAQKVDVMRGNIRALKDEVNYYRTSDSLSAASVERLTLALSEFKEYYDDLAVEAAKLKLNVKRLETVNRTATKTVVEFKTVYRDTIINVIEKAGEEEEMFKTDTIRCANYEDKFITMNFCEIKGIPRGTIEVRDTLIHFVHRVPKKFLFFKWGTKAVKMEVVSLNPYTKISHAEFIQLKK